MWAGRVAVMAKKSRANDGARTSNMVEVEYGKREETLIHSSENVTDEDGGW